MIGFSLGVILDISLAANGANNKPDSSYRLSLDGE